MSPNAVVRPGCIWDVSQSRGLWIRPCMRWGCGVLAEQTQRYIEPLPQHPASQGYFGVANWRKNTLILQRNSAHCEGLVSVRRMGLLIFV